MKSMFKKAAVVALIAGATLPVSTSLFAASKTATFQVTLTIQDDCSISASPLNFGSTGVLANDIDQSANLAVTCTAGTPYNVALDAGSATGSSISARTLTNTASTGVVQYNLFRDASRTQIWGQTVGSDTVSGVGNGNAQTIPVFGRVPVQATPIADTYTSTVTATVVF
ncbi:spore coat U domain-containing protein [Caballeronia sp. LZ062]|uniref:Csu type fimbrial protein n=1 Tax=unclassified Caballeronia TaxID=2646786 RepID=UPI0028664037|nr:MULTISPECIES: spore coat U domain-containing protein [unclassified Caballeronia]MDR5856294.1 spore coat U domain-containing protein [Caballeronia sp. LZ050]MDR5872964.1 spore coat U domain-containing protein [Caballeronia sp. LZ062]